MRGAICDGFASCRPITRKMLRKGHVIELSVIALLGLAVVMVHSAELSVGRSLPELLSGSKHALFAGIAVLLMLIASRVNVREVMQSRGPANPALLALALSLALVAVTFLPSVGATINGARRWLKVGGFMFQPSELVKWTLLITLAWWCARRSGVMHKFFAGLFPALLLIAVACGLIVIEDLGTAALIGLVAVIVLLAGGARVWQLGLLIPPAAAAAYAAIVSSPYRLNRLMVFLHPYDDPEGKGYQPIQSMLAIANGGMTGRGVGMGVQKHGYLPQDTSDFIFGVICSELGLAGAAMVIFLYVTILWMGLGVVRDCRDMFGRLVALGVVLTVGLQAMINIAVVTVTVPTKGIALPLLSAGGTGWIMTAASLGLVAAIDHANHIEALNSGELVGAEAWDEEEAWDEQEAWDEDWEDTAQPA